MVYCNHCTLQAIVSATAFQHDFSLVATLALHTSVPPREVHSAGGVCVCVCKLYFNFAGGGSSTHLKLWQVDSALVNRFQAMVWLTAKVLLRSSIFPARRKAQWVRKLAALVKPY